MSEGDSVPDNEFLTYASQQSQEVDEDFDDDEFDQETNTSEQTSFTVSDVMAAESGGSPIAHAVASSQSVTQKRDEVNCLKELKIEVDNQLISSLRTIRRMQKFPEYH